MVRAQSPRRQWNTDEVLLRGWRGEPRKSGSDLNGARGPVSTLGTLGERRVDNVDDKEDDRAVPRVSGGQATSGGRAWPGATPGVVDRFASESMDETTAAITTRRP